MELTLKELTYFDSGRMMFALTTLLAVVGLVAGDGVGHNKILNFPAASTANYISYKTDLPAMTGLTVCAWKIS